MIALIEQETWTGASLEDIEIQTREFMLAREALGNALAALQQRLDRIKEHTLPRLKQMAAKAAQEQSKLTNLVDSNRGLFKRPRTQVFHGVKVGLRKQKGGITWDDPKAVVERIHKIYGDGEDARSLLHITEAPDKKALEGLEVKELKKLGAEVVADSDAVQIKPVDDDVEKLINALLKDAIETD